MSLGVRNYADLSVICLLIHFDHSHLVMMTAHVVGLMARSMVGLYDHVLPVLDLALSLPVVLTMFRQQHLKYQIIENFLKPTRTLCKAESEDAARMSPLIALKDYILQCLRCTYCRAVLSLPSYPTAVYHR